MKTKCMSCGGPTKKMQAGGLPKAQLGRNVIKKIKVTGPIPRPRPEPSKIGGGRGPVKEIKKVLKKLTPNKTTPGCFGAGCGKMQLGGSLPNKKMGEVRGIKKTISTIKKTISNIGKPKPTTPKMELGGSLETFRDGGGTRRARQQGSLPSRNSCGEKIKRKKASWARQDKAAKILKPIGAAVGTLGGIGLAGAAAYKKSTPFKNAVDELKGKLGFNKTGGAVKYRDGGPTDSLKVIKKEGKLAVKTEKQKQAAAKKAAALAKKIAKAKENARLNLEWQKMTKDQKDSLFISERQKNW